ncbi:hypothetical protein ABGT15_04600 [Flavobacterium enshiense]|uniref:hypothetical protein n=1 Tax=Flavobacterium enshiense TaxID=1341165 RepID=UPI00345D2D9F
MSTEYRKVVKELLDEATKKNSPEEIINGLLDILNTNGSVSHDDIVKVIKDDNELYKNYYVTLKPIGNTSFLQSIHESGLTGQEKIRLLMEKLKADRLANETKEEKPKAKKKTEVKKATQPKINNSDKYFTNKLIKKSKLSPSCKLILLEINSLHIAGYKYTYSLFQMANSFGMTLKVMENIVNTLINNGLITVEIINEKNYLIPDHNQINIMNDDWGF